MAVACIKDSLKQQGVRLTRQRQILLELIDESGKHLDAETLFQLAKEKDAKLNRVTVYRTLKMLKETGLVDELDLMHYGGDQHYYETRLKQEHAHVICLRCGKVEEFFGEPLQKIRRQVEQNLGFQILLTRTEIGGYCPHCQALRAEEANRDRRALPTDQEPIVAPVSVVRGSSKANRDQRAPPTDQEPMLAPVSVVRRSSKVQRASTAAASKSRKQPRIEI